MKLRDSRERYGAVSRILHWGMAALIAWQFLTAITRVVAEDSALDKFLWATHKHSGVLLLVLIILRGAWALSNARNRPEVSSVGGPMPAPPTASTAARLGHRAMYGLILVIPVLALMRQYGSGKAFSPFGLPFMPGFDTGKIEWLMAPASLFHGALGWLLLATIVGHITMALVHRYRAGDEDVLPRMLGR